MSNESKQTPTLPVLRARAWSCHAASTIVGDVDGKQVVFAEVAGNGRYGEEDAVIAAEFVRRCNGYADLQSQNAELMKALTDARSSISDARLAELKLWLDRKWNRHGEEEDMEAGNAICELIAIRAALAKVQP